MPFILIEFQPGESAPSLFGHSQVAPLYRKWLHPTANHHSQKRASKNNPNTGQQTFVAPIVASSAKRASPPPTPPPLPRHYPVVGLQRAIPQLLQFVVADEQP